MAKDLEIIMFKSKQFEIIKALENENFVGADKTENDVNKLIDEFSEIFEGHGKLKNYQVKLYVNQEVQPVVQKLRRQPYHLRDAIRKELHRLESEDIIEK